MASSGQAVHSGPRVVVVTGGGKGIGKAVVARFAQMGDSVIALGRDERTLQEVAHQHVGLGRSVDYRVCDVTIEEAVESVFVRLGPVDVLVNNAGTSSSAPIHQTTLDQWQEQMAVNATGAFLCTRAVVSQMREGNRGRIVFVASTAGVSGYRYTSGYVASKHAEVGLMRAVATELAGTGVTANAVCPSYVRTEMTERSVGRISARTGRSESEALGALTASSPLGRLLESDEVAASVVFL
ncbi:MAG: SDR family oxidoreductase, partial [Actinomycetota bacterium]|nr:SDR family oxidoreductase [Actinomycetota bacterium]